MPVVTVTGPRQSGKSTLLKHDGVLKSWRYVTLDDATLLAAMKRDPLGVLGDGPVVVDEAQRAPELFSAIKRLVDLDRRPGRFVLSGSANFLLMHAVSESLAGRALHLHLGPLDYAELTRTTGFSWMRRILAGEHPKQVFLDLTVTGKNPGESEWLKGGLPPAALERDDTSRRLWFTGYEQTYLDRDLRDLTQVADLGLFHRFLRLSALRTAQVLNMNDLARDCGTNPVTISRWLSLLETSCLIQRLPPYFSNQAKRLVKAPKLYWIDSGLAAFLCGLHGSDDLARNVLRGAMAETYVCQNLLAWLSAHHPDARLTHYRSHSGYEVDFVVEVGQAVLAVEVKSASRVDSRDVKGLEAFLAMESRCEAGVVFYQGNEVLPLGDRMWAVPTGAGMR
jgi:predicted AAA+ superfamily ATPase